MKKYCSLVFEWKLIQVAVNDKRQEIKIDFKLAQLLLQLELVI